MAVGRRRQEEKDGAGNRAACSACSRETLNARSSRSTRRPGSRLVSSSYATVALTKTSCSGTTSPRASASPRGSRYATGPYSAASSIEATSPSPPSSRGVAVRKSRRRAGRRASKSGRASRLAAAPVVRCASSQISRSSRPPRRASASATRSALSYVPTSTPGAAAAAASARKRSTSSALVVKSAPSASEHTASTRSTSRPPRPQTCHSSIVCVTRASDGASTSTLLHAPRACIASAMRSASTVLPAPPGSTTVARLLPPPSPSPSPSPPFGPSPSPQKQLTTASVASRCTSFLAASARLASRKSSSAAALHTAVATASAGNGGASTSEACGGRQRGGPPAALMPTRARGVEARGAPTGLQAVTVREASSLATVEAGTPSGAGAMRGEAGRRVLRARARMGRQESMGHGRSWPVGDGDALCSRGVGR